MHRTARVLRRPRPGLRAAGPLQLLADAARRGHAHLQAGRRPAGPPPRLGDPLRRDGIERTTLVCLGVARHRLRAASPADPPPPDHQRARLLLLLPARRTADIPVPADLRRRAGLAYRRRFRVRQGLFRARPVPGPPVYRDRPAHGAGHGRPGHLRPHRRPAPLPHRDCRTSPRTPRPAPPAEFGMIPLTVPETWRLLAHPPPPGSAVHWLA